LVSSLREGKPQDKPLAAFVKEKFGPEFVIGKIIQMTSFFCALDTD